MESQCIHDLRKKLEQGKVSDTELANIELHVESILDSKIDAFVLSRHYKGNKLFFLGKCAYVPLPAYLDRPNWTGQ